VCVAFPLSAPISVDVDASSALSARALPSAAGTAPVLPCTY
jgi:hypothetical protein